MWLPLDNCHQQTKVPFPVDVSNPNNPWPAAVIFDFDGVLVNSEPLHFYAMNEILEHEKIELTETEYYEELLGMTDQDSFKLIYQKRARPLEPGVLLRLLTHKNETMMDLIFRRQLKPLPGVEEFVRWLWRRCPLAICSGARSEEVDATLTGLALRDCFSVVVGADDYPIGKPDPRVYRHTFELLQAKAGHPIKASACMVVEDSPAVIDRLRPEGFPILAVTNSRPADALKAADWVVGDLQLTTVAHAIPQLKLRA